MSRLLFDGESSDSEVGFGLGNEYAKKYDTWREKEEYQKLQAKYGKDMALDNGKEGNESSSSSEDEDAEEITPQVEKQFFETLSKLKGNDPDIYDPDKRFFKENSEQGQTASSKKKTKHKPMFLRDYEREMFLKTGGVQHDQGEPHSSGVSAEKSYIEEQEDIKAGFRSLLEDSDDENATGFAGSLLQKRQKPAAEKEEDDEQYKVWLKGQKDSVNDRNIERGLKGLKKAWSNPKIDTDEAFLRDYILSKRYLEEGDDSYVPSYEEVVHDSDGDLSEDERTLGQQEQFEHKFNFRFEEPDQEFVKRYPRTIKNSLRKKDERRKHGREEKKLKKEEEKKRKEEELKRLKTLKRKEILEKLETLKEVVGNAELPFEANDLDTDFDPDSHDKKMQEMFGEDYYYGAENDEEKPVFDDDEDWDNWDPATEDAGEPAAPTHQDTAAPACEQPGFVMDCEYDGRAATQRQLLEATGRGRKKRRGKLAEMLRRPKPRFQPGGDQALAEYIDQYYRLDEALNPHPFQYRQVAANDFGLDATEILMADEKDLNRWVSVKRMSQYRRDEEELLDVKKYKAKASNLAYKQKILQSLFRKDGEPEEDPETYEPQKKKKKKRKKKEKEMADESNQHERLELHRVATAADGSTASDDRCAEDPGQQPDAQESRKRKKKSRKKEKDEEAASQQEILPGLSTGNGNDVGENTDVARKRSKKRERRSSEALVLAGSTEELDEEQAPKKKKRSHKHACEDTPSLPAAASENGSHASPARKRKRKKGDGCAGDGVAPEAVSDEPELRQRGEKPLKKKHGAVGAPAEGVDRTKHKLGGQRKWKQRPKEGTQAAMVLSMSDARLEAFGLNPKKIRGKVLYGASAS